MPSPWEAKTKMISTALEKLCLLVLRNRIEARRVFDGQHVLEGRLDKEQVLQAVFVFKPSQSPNRNATLIPLPFRIGTMQSLIDFRQECLEVL